MAPRQPVLPEKTDSPLESESAISRLWSRIARIAFSTKEAAQELFATKPKPRRGARLSSPTVAMVEQLEDRPMISASPIGAPEAPVESSTIYSHIEQYGRAAAAFAGLVAAQTDPQEVQAQTTQTEIVDLVFDDFDFGINEQAWTIDDNYASNTRVGPLGGTLELANRGAITANVDATGTPDAPVAVSGQWTPLWDDASNTHSMRVTMRSDGNFDDLAQDQISLIAYTNLDVFLLSKDNGQTVKIAEDKSKVLKIGQTYDFLVVDSGTKVTAEFWDSNGNKVINLSANTTQDQGRNGNKIMINSRQNGSSAFDNVAISTTREVEPEPEPVEEPEEPIPEEMPPSPEQTESAALTNELTYELNWEQGGDQLSLTYANPASGYTLKFAGKTYELHQGNNTLVIDKLPNKNKEITRRPKIYDADGNLVGKMGRLTFFNGIIQNETGVAAGEFIVKHSSEQPLSTEPTEEVSTQPQEPEGPETIEMTIINDEPEESIENSSESDDTEITAVQEENNTFLYSRMHVTPGNEAGEARVFFMSPDDQTTFIFDYISSGGYSSRLHERTLQHEGGIADGEFLANLRVASSTGSVMIRMFNDQNQLVDQVTLQVGHGMRLHGGSNWEWGEMEEGRMVENPLESAMEIVATNGPQLSLVAQTAHDDIAIVMDGGGVLNSYSGSTNGGSSMISRNFAFNTSNPSGTYKITMKDKRNGMTLSEVEFNWNASTQTITPMSNGSVAALQSPSMENYAAEMQASLNNQADVSGTHVSFPVLQQVQRTRLYWESEYQFIEDRDDDMLLARYPNPDHPDAGSILKEGMAVYGNIMGELLEDAVDVAITAWNGGDQQAALDAYYRRYDELSILPKLQAFKSSFRVEFPTADQILHDGLRIAQEYVGGLQEIQAKNDSMLRRSERIASMAGPEQKRQISQAAREHNLAIVAMQHSEDSAEYYAYEATWGQGSNSGNPLEEDSLAIAMDDHREFLIAMYGENTPEFVRAYNEYLDSLDTMVLSEEAVEFSIPGIQYINLQEEYITPPLDYVVDVETLVETVNFLEFSEDEIDDAIWETVNRMETRIPSSMTKQGFAAAARNIVTRLRSGETNINTLLGTSEGLFNIQFGRYAEANFKTVAMEAMTQLIIRYMYDIDDYVPPEISVFNGIVTISASGDPRVAAGIAALTLPEATASGEPAMYSGMELVTIDGFSTPIILPTELKDDLENAFKYNTFTDWENLFTDIQVKYMKVVARTEIPPESLVPWHRMLESFAQEVRIYYFETRY